MTTKILITIDQYFDGKFMLPLSAILIRKLNHMFDSILGIHEHYQLTTII
jgi:hypothetical protein